MSYIPLVIAGAAAATLLLTIAALRRADNHDEEMTRALQEKLCCQARVSVVPEKEPVEESSAREPV